MMDRSDAPAMAALVACPARRECPAYWEASKPARSTSFFTTRATSIPDSRPAFTCPCRLMERNTGPAVMAACSIHACIVRTGHVWGFDPYGIPILRPTPSWSTFDRRNVTVRPSLPKTQSSTSSPTSSDRRNAPANPNRISARSRMPMVLASVASTSEHRAGAVVP